MNIDLYTKIKLTLGVIATIGLYSVLYKETKLYRFFEHIFLGLAAGFSLVAIWTELLRDIWWDKMVGHINEQGVVEANGYWLYAFLIPLGMMGYMVFSRKHNWISRVPIGMLLGFWSGQQIQVWWNRWGPQIQASMVPIWPTNTDGAFRTPPNPPENVIYPTQAINNFLFLVAILTALSYFFYSFDVRHKLLGKANMLGRWVLMVGFGAIFGATVMARFALVIDRMYFIWIEWFKIQMLGM